MVGEGTRIGLLFVIVSSGVVWVPSAVCNTCVCCHGFDCKLTGKDSTVTTLTKREEEDPGA